MSAILVPVDGSKISLRAVKTAIHAAAMTQGSVHLVNVEPDLNDYGMVGAYMGRKQHTGFMIERGQRAVKSAARALQRAGIAHTVHVIQGDIAERIVNTAKRLKCGSIVMGTRGMGAVGNLLLGSVAARVVHLSPVPVTLVK